MVVIDGREQGPYGDFLPESLSFSPDSQRIAYVAQRLSAEGWGWSAVDLVKWVAVVDGKASLPYGSVTPPIFSPDSRHVAYAAGGGRPA